MPHPGIDLTDELFGELVRRARDAAPEEACGLLAFGPSGLVIYGAVNVAEDPQTSFLISPREQLAALTALKDRGEVLAAIWHSHARSGPEPSPRDRLMAEGWPGTAWVIVGLSPSPALWLGYP